MAVAVVDGSILADSADIRGVRNYRWTFLHHCAVLVVTASSTCVHARISGLTILFAGCYSIFSNTWRARMKGYETGSRKAEKLLELTRRQKLGPVSYFQCIDRESADSFTCTSPTAPQMNCR